MAFVGTRSDIQFATLDWVPLPSIMAAEFDVLAVNVRSYREPLKRSIQKVLAPSLQANFDRGGRPDEWAELTDGTLANKRHMGYGSSPLIGSGALRRKAGTLNLWTIDGPRGEAAIRNLPSHAEHGYYHQAGWTPAGADTETVEPRPWAVIQTDDANEVEKVFIDWIQERIARDISAGRR